MLKTSPLEKEASTTFWHTIPILDIINTYWYLEAKLLSTINQSVNNFNLGGVIKHKTMTSIEHR